MNIAVVDDEKDFHLLFKMTFKKMIRTGDIFVNDFLNGIELLDFLELKHDEIKIIILFTDINMPEMDGISLCKVVSERYPDIEIYIASAYGSRQYMDEAKDAGAKNFFTKPIDFKVIGEIIQDKVAEVRKKAS
ncbi:hypothetical protein A9Q84_07935 [Halobacteriovorax marinus]|uniref:Response regulatory domain-containing protein n=1 Tax=Halobacteriovorax marinus TaxID=97084 RepID=A0A1Y5FDA8_9BACT|nr:hypothetical protein A9Q84_07935 [Halobacteriovorax marinus]